MTKSSLTASDRLSSFYRAVENRSLSIAVIGCGYVGKPLCELIARKGFPTIGFDTDQNRIESLRCTSESSVFYTSDPEKIKKCDGYIICVPTPVNERFLPDPSALEQAALQVSKELKPGNFVVLESTVSVGWTEHELVSILETSSLNTKEDLFVGFSPERIDPGNSHFTIENTPKLVSALTDDAAKALAAFYQSLLEAPVHIAPSCSSAEMSKLLENTYRNVNIALVSEFTRMAQACHLSIYDVIENAATKPYGFAPFFPGLGVGGHCIPVDPYYLLHSSSLEGESFPLIEAALAVNTAQPAICLKQILARLNEESIPIEKAHLAIIGLGYKPGSADLRHSPAVELLSLLEQHHIRTDFFDPAHPVFQGKRSLREDELTLDLDLVIIGSGFGSCDPTALVESGVLIFDPLRQLDSFKDCKNIFTLSGMSWKASNDPLLKNLT